MRLPLVALISVLLPFTASATELTIYSVRAEKTMKPILEKFTAETGIATKLVVGTHPELVDKLKAEGESTPADIFITKDLVYQGEATRLGLFRPFRSSVVEKNIPAHFIEPGRHWYLHSYRARVIMYNKHKVSPAELSTYQAIGGAEWKGRLCLRTSQNSYNQGMFAGFIKHFGYNGTVDLLRSWVSNLAQDGIIGGDTDVIKAIAAGKCDIGVANTYYLAFLIEKNADYPVRPFFPEQNGLGTHVNGGGLGIIRHSRNVEAATLFLEHMSRPESQVANASPHHEYPANPAAAPTEIVRAFGDFRMDPSNLGTVSDQSELGKKAAAEAGHK